MGWVKFDYNLGEECTSSFLETRFQFGTGGGRGLYGSLSRVWHRHRCGQEDGHHIAHSIFRLVHWRNRMVRAQGCQVLVAEK